MSTSGVNFDVDESSNMTTCPFCGIDGVTWLEYHLTGSTTCPEAPSSIKQLIESAKERHEHEQQGKNPEKTTASASGSRKRVRIVSPSNGNSLEFPEGSGTPSGWMNEAKKTIRSFFTENRFDFDALKSPTFHKMLSFFFGQFVPIPASDKLHGWILENEASKYVNEVRSSWPETGSSILIDGEVSKYVNEVRSSWAETGSSILIDGWTNAESQNFISVFVDSPKGTIYLRSFDVSDLHEDLESMKLLFEQVIEEVGSSNVVQIVTYSNSVILKEIGKQLMDKYRSTFWTVDTSFCFDLMIENYGTFVGETLEKAKMITRFLYSHHQVLKSVQVDAEGNELVARSKTKLAFPFFTLENLVLKEKLLKETFLSSRSEASIITTSAEGKRVANLVADKSFWANAKIVITTVIPLVRVIELMNEKKSHMDCIYDTMDQIKETIKEGLESKLCEQIWKVIDKVWVDYLYSPLHSAGYFLNPTIFYSEDVSIDKEVCVGLMHCVSCMAENLRDVHLVTAQLVLYQKPGGSFEVGSAVDKRSSLSPVEWWSKYGGECPELQKFAIRILSQTCSGASRLQLDRSLVENYFEERRNLTAPEGASEKVSLLYNMQLREFASGASNRMMPGDEIDPVWVRDWTGVSHS